MDTMQVAAHVAEIARGTAHTAGRAVDAIFIDSIGVGAGVYDRLNQLGFTNLYAVNGANAPVKEKYENKRAEMYGRFEEWLKSGGSLPNDSELFEQLTALEYYFNNRNRLLLESKQEIKKRGLASPDIADSYSLTFAEFVPPRDMAASSTSNTYEHDYEID
jgi:hypothetical protein